MKSFFWTALAPVLFYAGVTLLFIEKKSDRPVPAVAAIKAAR